jgi:Tat protein secretion system quality control protein TatD with DNase activity
MYLPEVVRVLAEARAQTEEHIARITTANAERFFGLD